MSEKLSDSWNTRERLDYVVQLARENKLERLTVTEWGIDVINNPILQAQLERDAAPQKTLSDDERKAEEERTLFWSSR